MLLRCPSNGHTHTLAHMSSVFDTLISCIVLIFFLYILTNSFIERKKNILLLNVVDNSLSLHRLGIDYCYYNLDVRSGKDTIYYRALLILCVSVITYNPFKYNI